MADTEALMRLVDEHAQAYHQHRVLMDSAPFDKQRAQESLSRLHKAAEAIRTHAAGVPERVMSPDSKRNGEVA